MEEESGRLRVDAKEIAKFEAVQKNSDDETKNFENQTPKLTEGGIETLCVPSSQQSLWLFSRMMSEFSHERREELPAGPTNSMQKVTCEMLSVRIMNIFSKLLLIQSSEKRHIDNNIDLKPSNILLNEITKISLVKTPNHSIDKVSATDFTSLDINSLPQPAGKTDVEMKITQLEHVNSIRHGLQLLLRLTSMSVLTFLTALKIIGCKSEEGGYRNNSSLNLIICPIVNQYPNFFQSVIAFNTLAFFLSVAWMLIIINKLPLRPLLLVSAFSMLGTYVCIIAGPSKPLSRLKIL